jgi:tRNA(Ile2) C34 agmatinyltransferase TiaS
MSRPVCEYCGGKLDSNFQCIRCGEYSVEQVVKFHREKKSED